MRAADFADVSARLHYICYVALWVLLFLPAVALAQTPATPSAGFAVCRGCHPDVTLNFFKNAHFRTQASNSVPKELAGCEGCHGPSQAHVEARGGKATIRAFSLMDTRGVLDACLKCHGQQFARANIRRSQHSQAEVPCTGCHSIHKSPSPRHLLAKKQADLCYDCHPSVKQQFSMPFKHRVNEGFVQCSDCHNPHGANAATWRMGARPRLVDQGMGNEEACLKCHSDKRGPFAFEHAAVRVDGCESCHSPHGSPNARLLKRPVVFTLCLECHNGAGNFGRQGDGILTQSRSHNMADRRYQNCTTCHVRIHGSNGDPLFLR